jgi:hypothetical protein
LLIEKAFGGLHTVAPCGVGVFQFHTIHPVDEWGERIVRLPVGLDVLRVKRLAPGSAEANNEGD